MSLTTLINGEFKDFFKEAIPSKKEFKTFSGKSAFSKEYVQYAEYKLKNPYNSTIVGTAFDYLARWTIAKNINGMKEDSYSKLIAEHGLKYCERAAKRDKKYNSIQKKYDDGIKNVERFVNESSNETDIIKIAIFFAKLENIWRSRIPRFCIDIEKLLEVEKEVFDDLVVLVEVFQTKFIDSGIVTPDSIVVYNPTFGDASYFCGGADAYIYIYIDGTLYDFKCTKKERYVWKDVAQILGYYLLDCISKDHKDQENDLDKYEIRRIAFYKARFGEIEYYDVSRESYLKFIKEFDMLLEKYVRKKGGNLCALKTTKNQRNVSENSLADSRYDGKWIALDREVQQFLYKHQLEME